MWKKNQKFIWAKSYRKFKICCLWGYPCYFFSKFAQIYSLTSRTFWLKKSCCARMSRGLKNPRKINFRHLPPQFFYIGRWGIKRWPNETQRQLCKDKFIWRKGYRKFKKMVYEGTPAMFKICTDILLDKPSILAEETLLCGCLRDQNSLEKLIFDFYPFNFF